MIAACLVFLIATAGPPSATYQADGSVSIVDTNYPIPADAFFVSPQGRDSSEGSKLHPWRSVTRAVATAPAGSTIVLRAGVYRESIQLAGKPLAFQPYPHEKAWFRGTIPITGWVPMGRVWRKSGWVYHFPPDAPEEAIDPAYPLAGHRDMVFLDGRPLSLVSSLAQVGPGTFFIDAERKQISIGDNPTEHSVEGTALPFALDVVAADGSMVRGLGFDRFATGYGPEAKSALRIDSADVTIENNTFAWNTTAGLAVFNRGAVVRGNTAAFNGQLGLVGYQADEMLMEHNVLAYNNQKHYAKGWEAGGAKVSKSHRMIWRENTCLSNLGSGLWCDTSCYGTTIVRNMCWKNAGNGITYEISAAAIIASNLAVENEEAGICVGAGSEEVRVYNNTLVANGIALKVIDDDRTSAEDPRITWNTRNVVAKNNLFIGGRTAAPELIRVLDYSQAPKTAAEMRLTFDYNGYARAKKGTPAELIRWPRTSTPQLFPTLAAFRAATGQEAHALNLTDGSAATLFVDPVRGDYRLRKGSPALGRGEPPPADLAADIGARAGASINLGVVGRGR